MTGKHAAGEPQTYPAVLMVRPAQFGGNAETAGSNFFQHASGRADDATSALREFDALALALAGAGVRVIEFAGQRGANTPDEVFPNNWLTTHVDGTVALYPMLAPNRRRERRSDVLAALGTEHGFRVGRTVDLTGFEARAEYLEGTGSLVLDRPRRVAYACLSPRTHPEPLARFASELGYQTVTFHATDRAGRPIYHTNVLLALGTHFAAVCTAAIANESERHALLERLEHTGRDVVAIGFDQLEAFAGNLLELRGSRGPIIALSVTAWRSFDGAMRRTLERQGEIVAANVATIERVGGGSVRCMLAEIALPAAR